MDIVTILLIIGGILLFYQLVLRKDDDRLDRRGRPLNKRRK